MLSVFRYFAFPYGLRIINEIFQTQLRHEFMYTCAVWNSLFTASKTSSFITGSYSTGFFTESTIFIFLFPISQSGLIPILKPKTIRRIAVSILFWVVLYLGMSLSAYSFCLIHFANAHLLHLYFFWWGGHCCPMHLLRSIVVPRI